ncbi:TPA: hypothetical protein ACTXXA_000853 [Legionella anisa]
MPFIKKRGSLPDFQYASDYELEKNTCWFDSQKTYANHLTMHPN